MVRTSHSVADKERRYVQRAEVLPRSPTVRAHERFPAFMGEGASRARGHPGKRRAAGSFAGLMSRSRRPMD